jgi:hypothetical protein
MNTTRVERALENAYDLDRARAVDIAFHLNDILPDLKQLVETLENAERLSDDEVADGILAMMLHTPAHLLAAAHFMGHTPEDVFEYGIVVEPRLPSLPADA